MKPDFPEDLPEDAAAMTRLLEALREAEVPGLRSRVFERVAKSVAQHRSFVTNRGGKRSAWRAAGAGVRIRNLYADAAPQRPGQPQNVQIVEMDGGARWTPAPVHAASQAEWLVLQGQARLEADAPLDLQALDFHVQAVHAALPTVQALGPTRLYLRHAPRPAAGTTTSRETPQGWQQLIPGILRRSLWIEGDEAAYLVRAERGAQVPEHGHAHDEECLMIEGDLFLGDMLLREGDWQLAPQGSQHGHHFTDTGLLLLVRGHAAMQFQAPAAASTP